MNSRLLFLFGCIPVRLLLALLAYKIDEKYLQYLSILFIGIGLSFFYLYVSNTRLDAPEAGGNTWWKNIRPIHGAFYLTAGIYALKKSRISALLILIDALFGLTSFILFREFKITL